MSLAQPVIDAMQTAFQAQSFMRTVKAEMTRVDDGEITIVAPLGEDYLQHAGFGHAGLTFALGDTAGGFAAATRFLQPVLTAEMKIQLLAPAKGDRLRAEGKVIKAGRRLTFVQADVYADSDGADPVHIALLTGSIMPMVQKT